MDFNTIPDILTVASMEVELPRSLRQIGELLKITYQLTDHPVLKTWRGHEPIDMFGMSIANVERFKRFNRTIVERTISQSVYYGQIQSDLGVLTMSSKGIEYSIIGVRSFFEIANKLYQSSENELQNMGSAVHYFRLTESGQLQAAIMYFVDVCNNLIELTHRNFILDNLKKIESDDEKVKYLLRQKANLLQQKDQFNEKSFENLIKAVEIELGYHNEIRQHLDIPLELKEIVSQFLAEKKARISNNKLLGFLLEDKLDDFCKDLAELVLSLFSYHDVGGQEPEKVYHAFLLGVLNSFKEFYHIESNKEAGNGRFDILLIPDTLEYTGAVIEVKRSSTDKTETITSLLDEALRQIVNNEYAIELKVRGHIQYVGIAAVFCGKNIFIKYQYYSMP